MADDLIERLDPIETWFLYGSDDENRPEGTYVLLNDVLTVLRAQPTSPSGVPSDAAVFAGARKIGGGSTFDEEERLEMSRDILTAAYAIDRPLASKQVGWQYRWRQDATSDWMPWHPGDESGPHSEYLHEAGQFETRAIYALASKQDAGSGEAKPLDTPEHRAMFDAGWEWHKEMTPPTADPHVKALEVALRELLHAACGNNGFAGAVRAHSQTAYPWPALDIAEERALKVLGISP